MAKNPPAFQLYTSDFISSTQDMDATTVGAYIRLLCFQWDNRSIPTEPKKIARIVGVSDAEFIHIWVDLSCKFTICEQDGRLVNPRLDAIRKERDEYVKNAAEFGKAGAEKRYGNNRLPDSLPYENPNGVGIALQSSSSIPLKEEKKECASAQDFSPFINPKRSQHCPTWEDVHFQVTISNGLAEQAFKFFEYNEKMDWRNRSGQPIISWQSMINTWLTNDAIKVAKDEAKKAEKRRREEDRAMPKVKPKPVGSSLPTPAEILAIRNQPKTPT